LEAFDIEDNAVLLVRCPRRGIVPPPKIPPGPHACVGGQEDWLEYKVVVLGEGGVGKSGLVLQHCAGRCPKRYDPTIEDSYRKAMTVDDTPIILDILDTAGQEEYASLRREYISETHAVVVVYPVTDRGTFERVTGFIRDIWPHGDSKPKKLPLVLVGSKIDLEAERQVSEEEGVMLAEELQESEDFDHVFFVETSALTNVNVTEVFVAVSRQCFAAGTTI